MTGLLINNSYPVKRPESIEKRKRIVGPLFETSSAVLIPIRDLETKEEIVNFLSKKLEKTQ